VIVLGFDTATPATAVALRLEDGTALRARDDPGAGERPGHTTRLLPLVRDLLEQADLSWDALDLIAVGVGPGTFTGLRVGVATARGLAQSLGIDVVGVGTPPVLARAAIADAADSAELCGGAAAEVRPEGVLAVIDARRGEAFVAPFAPHELVPVRALPPSELGGVAAAAGPELAWRAVGDGSVRFRTELEAAGIVVPADDSPLHRVDAGVLCELALHAPHGAPEAVLPDYRRRPDAEIALENVQQ
jgi:tRNA threonylcarbamoyladenosine biosynthesis protein TsaB